LQRADSYGPGAIATAGSEQGSTTVRERRHQIPGLLQTPYLKIYLLRCDDKDTYKATSRQLVRDWSSQFSSSQNKPENHDACEWLILHVVIPDTVAASEPRWTAASRKDTDELVERPQSSAKWPGKSTRTVLDKIRQDFTSSSKSGPERVAQLRLQKKDVPPQLLPKTPVPSPYTETPQEQDNAWQDLIAKLKTLILMSFDLRVSQYEEDIRERESQRSLPGWNFCTFFTLKEGLARGFESVGLVEDALAIYDELAAGFETQSTYLGDLSSYRVVLQQIAESDEKKVDELSQPLKDLFNQPLDLTKKDYRDGIVKNTISPFDFHLYIFARQRTLLLRLGSGIGTANQRRPSISQGVTAKDDNLAFYAEVCRRAAAFAASNARTLRKDLQSGYAYSLPLVMVDTQVDSLCRSESELSSPSHSQRVAPLIENLASSWIYAVLDQVLSETETERLPLAKTSGHSLSASQKLTPGGSSRKDAFNFPQGANAHPMRSTSVRKNSSGSSHSNPQPQVVYENERYSKSSNASQALVVSQPGSGIANLAAGRAELIMMQRRTLETVAKSRGWSTGWAGLVKRSGLDEVDLNGTSLEKGDESADGTADENTSDCLLSPELASPMVSLEEFRTAYEVRASTSTPLTLLTCRTASE